jgi:glycerophosphoryl diester phosphodiesterase
VHATRDGVIVVHHDAVPRAHAPRSALADRPIAELSFAELQGFAVDGGALIPTLSEVLAAVKDRAHVYIELKARGIEREVVAAIERSPAPGACAVHAFDHQAIARVKELCPAVRTGLLVVTTPTQPAALLEATGAADLWPEFPCIGPTLVRRVHEAGGRVIAWTVDDPAEAQRLAGFGVDGICTDDIPAIRTALSPST